MNLSKTYDGELTDVFELQERIARAITSKLQVVLTGAQQARLVPKATENPEAYTLFLQATAIFNRRDRTRFDAALAGLKRAVELDPGFARAWSKMGGIEVVAPNYRPQDFTLLLEAAEEHARKALALDPSLAEPHAVLGLALLQQRRRLEARAELAHAVELEPDEVNSNFWLALSYINGGYARQGIEVAYADAGDLTRAEDLLRRAADVGWPLICASSVNSVSGQSTRRRRVRSGSLLPFRSGLCVDSHQTRRGERFFS